MEHLKDLAVAFAAFLSREIGLRAENHLDDERYLEARVLSLLQLGRYDVLLLLAEGYLGNPVLTISGRAGEADDLIQKIRGLECSSGRVEAFLRTVAEFEVPIFETSSDAHSCYSSYRWVRFNEELVVAYQLLSGSHFCKFTVFENETADRYFSRYAKLHARFPSVFASSLAAA